MKKLLTLFGLLMTILGVSAEPVEIGGIFYNLNPDYQTAEVTSSPDTEHHYTGEVVIPTSVEYEGESYEVNSIGGSAFEGCSGLTAVYFASGVAYIGVNAFKDCTALTSLYLPNSVTSISNYAFMGCTSLEHLTLGRSVSQIKTQAFANCPQLTTVVCKTAKAPNVNANVFDQATINEATLKVPTGSLGSYQSDILWKSFKEIVEFELASYNLDYYVGGELYKHYEHDEGDIIFPEANPEKEGYSFSGWSEIPRFMPANDVTVTGSFTINDYSITYLIDGETYATQWYLYGARIYGVSAPKKEGYIFMGWDGLPETMPGHNIEVNATYIETRPFNLTYYVDDEVYKTYSILYDDPITPEPAPDEREGYTFSGWSEIPKNMPAVDVDVYGSFIPNIYKLTYVLDGETYKEFEVAYGTDVTPEADPDEREGYTFSGWSEIPETMPAHDVTVNGAFSVNQYALIYMLDGEEYKRFKVDYGAEIVPLEAPEKEGYIFLGWKGLPETMPAHDVTATGSLVEDRLYKLTYMVDGEEFKVEEHYYGETITPEPDPAKEGYTFSGWTEIPETMPAEDVIVKGSFTINQYNLIYMIDGEEYKKLELDYGTPITPEADPEKEGYIFTGWSEIPETMPANDVTVTGAFVEDRDYKLTYLLNDEEYKVLLLRYGTAITPEPDPVKTGYSFSGWSEIPEKMPAEDIKVTGTLTICQYKLTYMIGDDVYKEVTYDYGATIVPEPQPDDDSYASFEWVGLPETMPDHDVTVTANYEYVLKGDVNRDDVVNVVDIVDLVLYLSNSSYEINLFAADTNNDGEITVTDIVRMVSTILEISNTRSVIKSSKDDNNILSLSQTSRNQLCLNMSNETPFTAMQFDVELPDGVEVSDVALDSQRENGHATTCVRMNDGNYRVICYSMRNNPFHGEEGNLMTITLNSPLTSVAIVKNIHLGTLDAEDISFDMLTTAGTNSVDILATGSQVPFDVYDLNGRMVKRQVTSYRGLQKGVYIVNNKKITIK